MADKVSNFKTSLSGEETITRSVQFFSTAKFRTSSQSPRAATFDGMPPVPWFMLFCMILGLVFCIVPGIILWFMVIRKMRRFQNLVVTANPIDGGTEVSVSYPAWAGNHVTKFLKALPPLAVAGTTPPQIQ